MSELVTTGNDPIRIPRRRPKSLAKRIASAAVKVFDADFVFQKTRTILFYGFAPAVIYVGMTTEPRPESLFDLINILE